MLHLGDITKISGYAVPVVDCIIGGSPCQDLSIAGKRAGLVGERSRLFMEQIRVIKEMRESNGRTTGLCRPRFAVWENVPGALSSNKGEDFRIVLEEFCKIADETATVPRPPKGKWKGSGTIVGDGWSVAWRILDAQFWGVPQRRRRIALVCDFGGQSASEILFERKSMCGYSAESGTAREGTATGVENSTGNTGMYIFKGGNGAKAGLSLSETTAPTLTSAGSGMNQAPTICLNDQGGSVMYVTEHVSGTLRAQEHGHQPIIYNQETTIGKTNSSNLHLGDPCHTLGATVRRLTPLECERLQGYPDGWTDIGDWTDSRGRVRTTSDSARYKALGNSIALPPWKWVLKRLCACYERDATMASLFDGIGGFPLIWEQLNGKRSCLWASEIEEFPMAVTKLRFGVSNG